MSMNLEKVVNEIRDDLKKLYLQDQSAVWEHPFVAIIKRDEVNVLGGAKSEERIVNWLRQFRGPEGIAGIVVGRMVAKYSKTIRGLDGNPQVLEKAILVSGRMLDTSQTYVSITPVHEHKDLRRPKGDTNENAEPNGEHIYVPGVNSPDKVAKITDEEGFVRGFLEMQFGREQIFDSRKGERCALDPLIQGVIDTSGVERHVQ